jgi:hypothetical protein
MSTVVWCPSSRTADVSPTPSVVVSAGQQVSVSALTYSAPA